MTCAEWRRSARIGFFRHDGPLTGRALLGAGVVRVGSVPRGRSQCVAALRPGGKSEPLLGVVGDPLRGLLEGAGIRPWICR